MSHPVVEAAGREPAQRSPGFETDETIRIWWALVLARDVDTAAALLRGEAVEPARLDPAWVAKAQRHELVRLDVRAIDIFARDRAEAKELERQQDLATLERLLNRPERRGLAA